MANKTESAIKHIQELQRVFSKTLISRVNILDKFTQKLDERFPVTDRYNKQALKNTYNLAHKLAGAAATFQHTEVYDTAKKLENFCSILLDSSNAQAEDWFAQLQQLQAAIKLAAIYNSSPLSLQTNISATAKMRASHFKQPSIVLVDDDKLVASLIQEQVKHFGYQVTSIINPKELAVFLDSNSPEIILMDTVFPHHSFSGIDLVKQLQDKNKIHCPVVFLANQEGFIHRLEAIRAGGSGYIVKPINVLELVEVLDRYSLGNSKENYRALIIDDDPIVNRYFKEALESHYFICKSVTNPLIATAELILFRPDIILLDISMPDCSGLEIAAVIRQDSRFTHIPIIFLTADNNSQREIEALQTEGGHILNKDIEIEKLLTYVTSHSLRSKELHTLIERLRKDELRLQAVSQSTLDAIITLDSNGRIILWNNGARNVFGYQSLEVIGKPIDIIIPEQYLQKYSQDFNKLLRDLSPQAKHSIESKAITKDQKIISIELTFTEWQSGNEQFFTSIIRDISDRKIIENELNNQKENFKAIVNNSAEGIVTTNASGIIDMANPKAHKILAYVDNELKGKNIFLQLLTKAATLQFKQSCHDLVTNDRAVEVDGIRKDGSIVPLALNIAIMVVEGESKYVGTFHEITERKEVMQVLNTAKLDAESANNAKSQFLSTMSHELRTPLNVILGFTELLQGDLSEVFDYEQKGYLQRINSSGVHLLHLINDVLDLSTIESGKINLKLEHIDLVEAVNESLELITPQAYGAQIEIENKLPEEQVVYINVDASRLYQVLSNLLSNAIKYNQINGGISIWLSQANAKVRLYIKNTGYGIPEENMGDLFKPFQRFAANRSKIEGTGIGLTITKNLVELMGGKIGVKNDEGKSCTFWLEWGLVIAEEINVPPITAPLTYDGLLPIWKEKSMVNILYIEDKPSNRLLMKKIVNRHAAFQYNEASTGCEGIELALRIKPDIILLDINLPDMNGFEVFKQLQQNNMATMTKVIAVSADAMQNNINRSKEVGFFDYVTKPISQQILFTSIYNALKV